jgi:hypothetical protein
MKNLKVKSLIWMGVLCSVLIWIILMLVNGVGLKVGWQAVKLLPTVVTLDAVLWGFFAKWGWRWPVCQRWLVPFPDLQGTWVGEVVSTWQDPTTGKRRGSIPVALSVKQSFTAISCVMYSEEMTSESHAAEFLLDPHTHVRKLVYSYVSTPKPGVRERSEIHNGTALLEIVLEPERELRGSYWNDRKSTGEITLRFRQKGLIQGYPQGNSLA